MKALLKFELRKLLQNKVLYICLGICAFLLIVNAITTKVLADIMKEAMEEIGQAYEPTDSALSMMKNIFSNNTLTIEAVVISLIVCEDFVGDVVKNIYSKGYSRTQVFFAKLFSSFIAFSVRMFGAMITSFLSGAALFGQIGKAGQNYFPSLLCICLVGYAFFAIYFAIAILFKKIAPSIILSILGPVGVTLILALADGFLNKEDFALSDYWINSLLTNLSLTNVEKGTIFSSIIISFCVISLFITLSLYFTERKDVK